MYKETQRFKQPWIWVILGISGFIVLTTFGTGIYKQIILGEKFGNHPMSDAGLITTFCCIGILFILLFALIGFARLSTIIDKEGIRYQFFPFHFSFHLIKWELVDHCEVITYHPIREYGGWGIRFGNGGKAYNVSGNKGLQIYLKSGKKLLIGTQNEMELTRFFSGNTMPKY